MLKEIDLEYKFSDLEPFIDTHTLGLHYEKHYIGYLKKLNELLRKNNLLRVENVDSLIDKINDLNLSNTDDILFNLGGVLNHELYFESISPNKKNDTSIMHAINNKYGNYENFKNIFINKAMNLKGSGYTFLVLDNKGEIDIINLPNQMTPYYYGLIPLMNIDLWEHAYYINYENRKKDYIDNFFEIVNYSKANELYEKNKIV